jgi:hypothetical protein
MQPQIITPDIGRHNAAFEEAAKRIDKSSVWKKLDTIAIFPNDVTISTKVVASWMNLVTPPNNKYFRLFAVGMEIGEAYSKTIEMILAHPDFSTWKYLLTIEADNIPPSDGIIKLLDAMENHPEFACIGGLYWTKGEGGVPQIWGDPKDPLVNYRPQVPVTGKIVECCGTGMGFNIWRIDMFKDQKLRKPWFRTLAGKEGVSTQDLYFWTDARKYGYRCAVDCSVLVGHYDVTNDMTW